MTDKIESKEIPKETEIPKEQSEKAEKIENPKEEKPQIKTEMCQLIYYDFTVK